jgi:hypothetical protein
LSGLIHNQIVALNLRDCGLYSEDLFILSQSLKLNSSLREVNLSKNMIGYTFKSAEKILHMKMKNKSSVEAGNFDSLFYNTLGMEHFAIAFKNSDRLNYLDLSNNDLGTANFCLLLPVFKANNKITKLNLADTNINGESCKQLC